MAATAHPMATDAAYRVLRLGGHGVDAAVAASFVISVVRPQSTGIGGGGFLLYHDHKTKANHAYDFRERAPRRATETMFVDTKGQDLTITYRGQKITDPSTTGPLAVGVPGLVAGLAEVHRRHGRLAWAQLLEPAIRAAEDGFPVYQGLAHALKEREVILRRFPNTAKIFFPNGKLLHEGDLLVQKDLATTLKLIAKEGPSAFYRGEVAQKIVKEMTHGSGLIDQEDLSRYQVIERQPVEGVFRGAKILSMPPPSSGGVHVVQILNMLEASIPSEPGGAQGSLPQPGTAAYVHLMTEIMKRAFADRAEFLGDPNYVKVPVKELLSTSYARKLISSIDVDKATPSREIVHGPVLWSESPSTTHLSIVDSEGNGVSTTQTINYTFGASIVAEGTGIVLNNEMDDFSRKPGVPNAFGLIGSAANSIAPGKTMLSSMSPTFVFDRKGELDLVVGSPGGPKIITATLQTLVNRLAFGMTLEDAVHHSRIHHQWIPDVLVYESGGLSKEVADDLKAKGHILKETKDPLGDVQAVGRESGVWTGVSDIRSDGAPRGY
jgi:gamma-glutamyltranspeptidase/glutathione hydrolase